jgi:hypothetical protein
VWLVFAGCVCTALSHVEILGRYACILLVAALLYFRYVDAGIFCD